MVHNRWPWNHFTFGDTGSLAECMRNKQQNLFSGIYSRYPFPQKTCVTAKPDPAYKCSPNGTLPQLFIVNRIQTLLTRPSKSLTF